MVIMVKHWNKGTKRVSNRFKIKDIIPPTHPITGKAGKIIITDSRGYYICPACMFGFRNKGGARYHAYSIHEDVLRDDTNDQTKA
jgi:hypothetical protein